MADYISTLSGVQMDAALMDMAEHNSEAYAVGERNGNPVGADDVTYHNNARYYAQQAQSIAPASVTEAVRWDVAQTALTDAQREQARENINAADNDTSVQVVTQTFTSAQQEIARANIAAGGTNPNLLDNPWFGSGEVVNQRGATNGSTTHNAYSIDRWKMSYGNAIGTWSIGANGLTISAASGTYALFDQVLPTSLTSYISGKTLTASCLMSDGSIYSGTAVWTSGTSETFFTTASNFRLQLLNTNAFRMVCNSGASNTVRAVKLELGSVSTLANDTPPDYGTELLKCMRYFERIKPIQGNYANFGMGYASTTTQAIIFAPMQPKRDYTYTVTASGSFRVSDSARNYTVSAVAKENGACASNTLVLYVTTTGTAMTAGTPVMFGAANSNTCYIDISNDL